MEAMEATVVEAPLDPGSAPPEFDELAGGDQPELAGGNTGDPPLAFGTAGRFCLSLRINLPAVGHSTSLPGAGAHVGRSVPHFSQESVTMPGRALGRPPEKRSAARKPNGLGRRWFLRSSLRKGAGALWLVLTPWRR
jgi:hypothetical protein